MALRPEIALGVRPPNIYDPGQVLTLQNVAQQNQMGKLQMEDFMQSRAERDQLKALF